MSTTATITIHARTTCHACGGRGVVTQSGAPNGEPWWCHACGCTGAVWRDLTVGDEVVARHPMRRKPVLATITHIGPCGYDGCPHGDACVTLTVDGLPTINRSAGELAVVGPPLRHPRAS